MRKKLNRTLGLYSATMVSVGSMIGGAIFVLAGTVFKMAGPSATLAIFLAGIATFLTSFSFAEFSTFVPEAGGGYSYVRATFGNNFIGFFTGWILWIGYALSASLFAIGFGNFLNYFIPFLPGIVGSLILIIYVTSNQISGIKNSALLQNTIVTIFVAILIGYIIYGFKFAEVKNVTPFFSNGFVPMFQTMSILYMTYIGFDAVTTLGEEVKNPKRTIPLAIMISMVVVIVIKTLAFFIGSAILNVNTITAQNAGNFMINTAKIIGGPIGGYIFAGAGILATLSCMNTSLLASSRTSFALSRDKKLPYFFQSINPKTQSPIFSIVVASIIILIATITQNIEEISIIASSLTLTGYAFINLSLIYARKMNLNTENGFKTPLYPYIPIFAIGFNVVMIFILLYTDRLALGFVMALWAIGIVYYLLSPRLKTAPRGISNEPLPFLKVKVKNNFKVLSVLEDEEKAKSLLDFSFDISNENAIPIGIIDIPDIVSDKDNYETLKGSVEKFERIRKIVSMVGNERKTNVDLHVILSKDREKIVDEFAIQNKIDMILMEWKEEKKAFSKWEKKILERSPVDVGIMKFTGNQFKRILFPYSGSIYSQMAADLVKRIADAYDAKVTILKIIYEENEKEIEEYKKVLAHILETLKIDGEILIEYSPSAWQKIVELSKEYDLVIVGISTDWNTGDSLLGLKTDLIFEEAQSSVLAVRAFHEVFHNQSVRKIFEFIKKFSP
ncbi:APC family permease [Athalassotoga saccharophila]|uniref:APC family permease n=1 Tax=Athalassotoga saccharophila TaxID=1441386 RepID=UPI00137B13B1|nr:APC family permease [Athalassotoga saccharophila]BBJ27798.1 putative amino acid permease YhdG [Athalassotoga saccharophila]